MSFRSLKRVAPAPAVVKTPQRAPLLMRPLEPRILLDAAGSEAVLDAANELTHGALADAYLGSDANGPAAESAVWARAAQNLEHIPPYIPEFMDIPDEQPSEIAFIASDVPDIDALLASLPSHVEIVVLDAGGDGVSQIADVLGYRTNLDAVHIFSHGSPGSLSLGTGEVNSETMTSVYRDELVTIGRSLAADGDILIYGCDFAGGAAGAAAVDALARLTGADIAASDDLTGHASLGGDWELERKTGIVESRVLKAGPNWLGVLAPQTIVSHETDPDDIDDDEKIASDRSVGQTFQHDSGAATYEIDQVDLVLRQDDDDPVQNVIVSIRETFTGADIATGTISSSSLDDDYEWHSFVLDSTAVLNSNQTYYIVVSTDLGPPRTVEVGVENDGVYADGAYIRPNGTPKGTDDLLFRLINDDANTDPTITSDGGGPTAFINMDENQTLATTVTATDSDLPANTLTYSIVGGIDQAHFTIDAATGELRFVAAPDFENPTDNFPTNGIYNVIVEVSDGFGGTDAQLISVEVNDANDLPVALGSSVATNEDTPFLFDQTHFPYADQDGFQGQSITVSNLNLGSGTLTHSGGTVVVTNGMVVTAVEMADLTFTPGLNENGSYSFDYATNDSEPGIVTATVDITVTPVNDAPAAADNVYTVNEDTSVSGNAITDDTGAGFDSDPDGDALSLDPVSIGTFATALGGAITLSANGDFSYTPAANFNGADSFIYTLTDGARTDTAVLTFSVLPVNDNPVARSNVYNTLEDAGAVSGNILTGDTGAGVDTDSDGGTLQVTGYMIAGVTGSFSAGETAVISGVGSLIIDASGAFTFSPVANYFGTVPQVTYFIADGQGGTAASTVDVTIAPVNDAPVSTGSAIATSVSEPVAIPLAAFAYTDVEGDAVQSVTFDTLSLAGGRLTYSNGMATVAEGMTLTAAQLADLVFEPAAGTGGTANIGYKVNDSDSGAQAGSLVITATGSTLPEPPTDPGGVIPDMDPEPDTEPDEDPDQEPETGNPAPVVPTTSGPAPAPAAAPNISPPQPQELAPAVFVEPEAEPEAELPTPPPAPIEEPKPTKPPSISAPVTKYSFEPINRDVFNNSLKETGDEIRENGGVLGTTTAKVTFAFGAVVGVGSVSWLIQSGILAATLLSALPAWKRFDPIAIVSGRHDEGEDEDVSDFEKITQGIRQASVLAQGEQAR